MTNEKKHKQPKYSLEFKQDAAKLVLEKGHVWALQGWLYVALAIVTITCGPRPVSGPYKWPSGAVSRHPACCTIQSVAAT